MSTVHRTLLLASPSVATREDTIKHLFTTHGRSSTDLQMLDRMNDGLVTLPVDVYDLVVIVKDQPDALRLLTRHVFATLVPAMKIGCKLQAHNDMPLDESEAREAVLSGLVKAEEGWFEKFATHDVVPLKLGKKTDPNKVVIVDEVNWDAYVEDSDLIDEDELLMEEDFAGPKQNGKSRNESCSRLRFTQC
jgi:anamorsin